MIRRKKVLIIDPSPIFRSTLKAVLQTSGAHLDVAEAKNTAEAEYILSSETPDVVFLDIALPHDNGIKFIKTIKTRFPGTCIVVLTSHDSAEHKEASIRHGADYFLSKEHTGRLNLPDIIHATILQDIPA